jgi:hypothetical protein
MLQLCQPACTTSIRTAQGTLAGNVCKDRIEEDRIRQEESVGRWE